MNDDDTASPFIAVVGMAGRFPGAPDVATLWRHLVAGDDPVTRFGTNPASGRTPAYGVVDDADAFDAAFFGYSPGEALMLDPQHRVFMECAWEALEHAGIDPFRHAGRIGVYGGSGDTGHFQTLLTHRDELPDISEWQLRLASGADFLTSRVSYKLGLTGPALTVQTACSTSLVAVHVASQALLAGECDVALAGGVTVRVPHPVDDGEDGVVSPDGVCRAFDADANGTVASDGAGVVVLKRVEDALAGGDHVHGVIRGSAVTNDGSGKIGFTTPSVEGQAGAVQAALALADVDPAAIDFVQAHGTGTPVGDPIEVRALTRAFGLGPEHAGSITLGSVKAAIGHTDAAAGVIGLITTILAMTHEQIPGTAHFRAPNPGLDLDAGPFMVTADTQPWPRTARPRLAAVNSLGLGGTNAHLVVEEPSVVEPRVRPTAPRHQVLPLSASDDAAMAELRRRLADHLESTAETSSLADVAWTLQTGRTALSHRRFVVADGIGDAVAQLRDGHAERGATAVPGRRVAFVFQGQGGQHVQMGRELYEHEPVFRAALDECLALIESRAGVDLRDVLYPDPTDPDAAARARERLVPMRISQPAVFSMQYALATLWRSWGVEPDVVLGHSLGTYAAAAIAGVLSLPDALTLVLERSRLLDSLPAGAMLAVAMPEHELEALLSPQLALAAVNGPAQCVVTGPAEPIADLHEELEARGVDARPLQISAAAHSLLVDDIADEFEALVASVNLSAPAIPWLSDRTGTYVTGEQARDAKLWREHLRHTVRFSDALEELLGSGDRAVLEIGCGQTLGTLTRRHPAYTPGTPVVASLPHAADPSNDAAFVRGALGRLWRAGVDVDWAALHVDATPRRTPLPTYPFQRRRFRLGARAAAPTASSVAAAPAAVAVPNVVGTTADTEQLVAAAFADVLGMDDVDSHDNFFDLGGDSLIAARLIATLRETVGAELAVAQVFRAPTIARLATLIDQETR